MLGSIYLPKLNLDKSIRLLLASLNIRSTLAYSSPVNDIRGHGLTHNRGRLIAQTLIIFCVASTLMGKSLLSCVVTQG